MDINDIPPAPVVPVPNIPMERAEELELRNRLLEKIISEYRAANLFECCTKCFEFLSTLPARHDEVKDIFIYSLYLYGRYLATTNCYEEVVSIYNEALEVFPNEEKLLYHYGHCLFLNDKMEEAKERLNTVLATNTEHVPARRILNEINAKRVKSNVIAILNDEDKNKYYIKAIKDYIALGYDDALFVKAGICNFAVIAAKNGANTVYTCETNEEIIKIARKLFLRNMVDVGNFEKETTDLDMRDFPNENCKLSLLVLDIHKYGTLLEGLMTELFHLWQHIMKPSPKCEPCVKTEGDEGVVIPSKIEICCSVIECDDIAIKYYNPCLTDDTNPFLNFRLLDYGAAELYSRIDGTYESYPLQIMNVKYITEPTIAFNVNLNDKNDIYRQLYENIENDINVEAKRDGEIHAIAAWFNCQVKSNLIITSNPQVTKSNVLEQAIFLLKNPIKVTAGSVICIKCKKVNDKVKLYINSCSGTMLGNPVQLEEFLPIIVGDDAKRFAVERKLFPCGLNIEILKMLNDVQFTKVIKATGYYILTNMVTETLQLRIFDSSPFPLLGLLIMLNIKSLRISRRRVKLYCNMEDIELRQFLEYICLKNGLNFRSLYHFNIKTFTEPCWKKDVPFDIILTDIIKPDGDLNERVIADMTVLRACLRNWGYMFPGKVDVVCQLMECKWIEDLCYVTRMDDINMKPLMNEYKIHHRTGLYLSKLNKKPLSDVFECATLTSSDILLNEFQNDLRIQAIDDGHVTVVGYWYNLCYSPNFATYSTNNDNSAYQQAAFVYEEPIKVSKGEVVLVTFKYQHGYINIQVKKNSD